MWKREVREDPLNRVKRLSIVGRKREYINSRSQGFPLIEERVDHSQGEEVFAR